jgi:hypothetical protein
VNVIHMKLRWLHMGCVCHGRGSVSIVGMYNPACYEALAPITPNFPSGSSREIAGDYVKK